ncbi:hypothetical protein AOQ73_18350 [Bradyrhizobium pachyrhizi]|nr:hypothetical protein AOQ73_18350 [Bradyrhizobium pachyrhizi]
MRRCSACAVIHSSRGFSRLMRLPVSGSFMKLWRFQTMRPTYSSFCRMPFMRLRLPAMVEAFQAPPRGPGSAFLFSAAAMSRGDLASR